MAFSKLGIHWFKVFQLLVMIISGGWFLYAFSIISRSLSASSPEGEGWVSSFMQ
jgi:hypothetical protein